MVVTCEGCGRNYNIDVTKIKGPSARFKCKACNYLIMVEKPPTKPAAESAETPPAPQAAAAAGKAPAKPGAKKPPKRSGAKIRGLGLRSKMLLLFLLIPIIVIAAASFLYLRQLNDLASLLTEESSKMVIRMAENEIAGTARSVARQCSLFILSRPELPKENFDQDPAFRKVAVQKVGKTGYTALYELPGPDGVWRTWAHANAKIIGIDMSTLKKPLKTNFPGFWKVYTAVEKGREARGYYGWKDKDEVIRDKFMVCTPVEGTRYIVAATTYLDEFTRPVKLMQAHAEEQTGATRTITYAILAGALLMFGTIVSLYGYALTRKIKYLTDTADRISVGELNVEIEVKSKDEIGALAEAISRMQESIRLSIERLRRRR